MFGTVPLEAIGILTTGVCVLGRYTLAKTKSILQIKFKI